MSKNPPTLLEFIHSYPTTSTSKVSKTPSPHTISFLSEPNEYELSGLVL